MDPFTIGALLLSACGIFSGMARREAAEKRAETMRRLGSARSSAKWAKEQAEKSINQLVAGRIASHWWLFPKIDDAVSQFNISIKKHNFLIEVLHSRGKFQRGINRLLRKAKKFIISPNGALFDNWVTLASSAAFVIKGLKTLDGFGVVNIHSMHQTVNTAITGLAVDGLDIPTDALGSFGDMAIADIISDGLVIFSAVKILYNIGSVASNNETSEKMESQISTLYGMTSRFHSAEGAATHQAKDLSDTAYQVFKWTMLAEAFAEQNKNKKDSGAEIIKQNLLQAVALWWKTMRAPLPTV